MLFTGTGLAYTGGSPTTRVLCYVSKEGAARALGGGTSPSGECFHVGGGLFAYFPTASETNADHVVFQFETNNEEALPVAVNVYPKTLTEAEEEKLQRGVQALDRDDRGSLQRAHDHVHERRHGRPVDGHNGLLRARRIDGDCFDGGTRARSRVRHKLGPSRWPGPL
jgi:hypothetical protein